MKTTKIKLQSIIDVITNSSTEVFVMATDRTVKYVKDLLVQLTNTSIEEVEKNFDIYLDEEEPNYMDMANVSIAIDAKNDEDKKYVRMINNLINSFSYDGCYDS